MLNLLHDYIWRSLPEEGDFVTNPNLTKKVGQDGAFLPFVGNTTVFLLDPETKRQLRALRDRLYRSAPGMLAEPLQEATFHMTLHDLANGVPGTAGLAERMAGTEYAAKALVEQWKDLPPLKMKGTWMFNMVSTSIVLGMEPADGDSCRRLDEMYAQLETVVTLGYALTPHITLAFYLPGVYGPRQIQALREALGPVALSAELRMEDLVLQNFADMNHYTTV